VPYHAHTHALLFQVLQLLLLMQQAGHAPDSTTAAVSLEALRHQRAWGMAGAAVDTVQ